MTDPARAADDPAATAAAHTQASYDVRLEWGPTGGAAVAAGADLAVVVDVLSFTTTLTIAVAQGTRVFPFAWKDERAATYAAERDAVLAVGRFEALELPERPPSLSAALLLQSAPVPRLVLPSPNGSTICAALAHPSDERAAPGPRVVGASLRNARAVAAWLAPQVATGSRVAFVPAGERWPDGSLRPALEDLWGAGAVVRALLDQAADDPRRGPAVSPEAQHAAASYETVAERLADALHDCATGRELRAVGFGADVDAAADLDADEVVPVLTDDGFADAAQRQGVTSVRSLGSTRGRRRRT